MSKTNTVSAAPVFYKFDDLEIDPKFSRRSPKEIRDNAKELESQMEAHGAWDAMQPGQVTLANGGKPRVIAGFTRITAAQSLGYKGGWFFEVEVESELQAEMRAITTNGGKPISRTEQGKLFARWTKGVPADDFKEVLGDPKKKEHWKIQPLDGEAIGRLIGKTGQHVRDCITIFDSTPEIGALIESEQISSGIVVTAYQWAKDDGDKALRILKAAIKQADGGKATKKHMDAIKADWVKLKAAVPAKKEPAKQENATPTETPQDNKGDSGHDEQSDTPDEAPEPQLDLGADEAPQPPKVTPKKAQKIGEALDAFLIQWNEERTTNLTAADLDHLSNQLILNGFIVSELPF